MSLHVILTRSVMKQRRSGTEMKIIALSRNCPVCAEGGYVHQQGAVLASEILCAFHCAMSDSAHRVCRQVAAPLTVVVVVKVKWIEKLMRHTWFYYKIKIGFNSPDGSP